MNNKILAAITTALVTASGVGVPNAAARPGTPTDLRAVSPNPWTVDFYFTNTASESVGFEWELTANGVPIPLNTLDCLPRLHKDNIRAWNACDYAPDPSNFGIPRNDFTGLRHPFVAFSTHVAPETTYCFRVRAREFKYGLVDAWQSGVVSEIWSSWVCATTGPTPNPPPAPSKPKLTYFPKVKRAEGEQPSQLAVEWDGTLMPPDERFEIEFPRSSGDSIEWISWSQPVTRRTGTVYRYVITHLREPSPTNPLTYRVCNANRFGRSCSLSSGAYESVAARPGSLATRQTVGGGKLGPPTVQGVVPHTYTKVTGQPPEYLEFKLTFEGTAPSRARYSIDDGLRIVSGCAAFAGAKVRCWLDAAQLIVVGNTATVWIPYSAIQQTQQQVQIQLLNNHGESIGTVRVLPAYGQTPSLKTETAPQKTLPAPAPAPAPRGQLGR